MRRLILEELLGTRHPDATFHDSELEHLHLNFSAGSAVLRFRLCISAVTEPEAYASGELVLGGLLFFAIEPPSTPRPEWSDEPLSIISDGPLPDSNVKLSTSLPTGLPDNAFCHYLFSGNTNSFIVLAATEASFVWHVV